MKLADFYPYVVPHVPDVILPTVDMHIRKAARDFFRRTLAWQQDMDEFSTEDGRTEYELSVPTGADVVRVLSVSADGDEFVKATKLLDNLTLVFDDASVPKVTAPVTVRVALTPRVGDITKTWSLPTELDGYVDDIANGALSSLLATREDRRQEAAMYGSLFSNRINVTATKVSRKFARTRIARQSTAQHF